MGKQQDVIRTFVSALCNTNKTDKEALDEAIRACSSFNNTDEVIAGILNARNAHGYSFLKTYCGIDLGNSDDGAITGSDAEGGSTKTQDSVITEYGNLDESFCGNEFTTQSGLTVKLGDGLSFYSLTSDQQFIWRCLKTWWIEGATTLIKDSYGDYFNVQGMTLEVEFKSDSANASGWGAASYGLSNGFLHLEINKDKYSNMNKSNYNGTTYSGAPYLDRLIAHELTHAITGAKGIAYGMPQFITEGLAELTRGIDNQYKAKITSLSNGTESLSKWLNVSDKSTGNWYAYAAGYIFLRYLAKQGATNHQSSTLFTSDDDNQHNTESGKVVNGFAGNDYINNTASNVTMKGGDGNDTLDNWYGHQNVKMYGNNGNDYFKNSSSYVTMEGGDGNDELNNYTAGTSVVINGDAGNDYINNTANDVTMTGGDGNDTLDNWAGNQNVKMYGNNGDDYFKNSSSYVTMEGGDGNDSIYNYEGGSSSQIDAGTGDDFINNGASNVTMRGGTGNDTLITDNSRTNVEMHGEDGDDNIRNSGNYITMYGGAGADSIHNDGNYNFIDAGSGNDSVWNFQGTNAKIELGNGYNSLTNWHGGNSTIKGGTDADFIHNNDSSYSSINAGDGNDTVRNESSTLVTINAGRGNDLISIDGSSAYSVIQYAQGDGNDTIYGARSGDTLKITSGSYSSIQANGDLIVYVGENTLLFKGNPSIIIDGTYDNSGKYINRSDSYVMLYGGNGNDTIHNWGHNVTMQTADGNDEIFNADSGHHNLINTGDGDDNIANYASYVTVNSGSGNDIISINDNGDSSSVSAGDGYDSVHSSDGDYMTIDGGNGNDSVTGNYWSSKINGGSGSDLISIGGVASNTIEGGDGSDTIKSNGGSINGGAGYDRISIESYNGTVEGGTGDDVIFGNSSSILYRYNSGDGADTIYGITSNDTLQITGAKYSKETVGNDLKIKVGKGSILLKNAVNIALTIDGTLSDNIINGTSGNDSIQNDEEKITINAGAGNDTIHSAANYVSINAGTGNDTIRYQGFYGTVIGGTGDDFISLVAGNSMIDGGDGEDRIINTLGDDLTINGGEGNDYIFNLSGDSLVMNGGLGDDSVYVAGGRLNSIDGGAGADRISLSSLDGKATVKGGTGNDIIYGDSIGSAVLYQFYSGDGYDTIYGYKSTDTINLGGVYYTRATVGSNVVVSLTSGSTGAVTLYGASGKTVNITNGTQVSNTPVITNTQTSTVVSGTSGNDTTYNTASNVTINGGSGNDSIYNSSNYVKIEGGTGDDKILNEDNGYSSIFGGDGNDSIYSQTRATVYGGSGNDTINVGAGLLLGEDGDDVINVQTWVNVTVNGGKGNDKIINSTVEGVDGGHIYQYVSGDGYDTIYGYKSNDTITISGSKYTTVKSGNDLKISVDSGSILLKDAANIAVKIYGTLNSSTANDTLPTGLSIKSSVLTASAKFTDTTINLANYSNATKVNASAVSQSLNIVGNASNNSMKGGKGSDTISGDSGKDTILGGEGNDKLYGGNDNDVLKGDAGNDSLYGGSGNDTLTGGTGNDVFIYEGGNDVITDYTAGQDKIKISNGSITSASLSDSNVVLKTSNGSITVKSGKGKKLTIIDANGNETTDIYPADNGISVKGAVVTASAKLTGTKIDLKDYSGATKVNASAVSQSLNIVGNSSNNSMKGGKGADTISGDSGKDTILGGEGTDKLYGGNDNDLLKGEVGNDIIYGDSGNDSLYGGEGTDKLYGDAGNDKLYGDAGNDSLYGGIGNDTLTGGTGNDIFIYEGGNDVITDYTAGQDKIKISSGKISKTTYKNKDVIFTIGNGTLTVKNDKGKDINVTDTNNNTRSYSRTLDLLYDNNFMTEELQIDDVSEVTADNYSVGQINYSNDNDKFVTDSIVSVAYLDKK